MILRIVDRGDPLRADIETYVRRVFARQRAAVVREFPEHLVAILGSDHVPLCAAGIRTAEDGFFSECYLNAPVESVLSHVCGDTVARDHVIEVTSFASERPGYAFMLLDHITQLGRAGGRTWGLFTATEKLRRCLTRAGLAIVTLGSASAEAVPNREDWGRYYDAKPAVCAMHDHQEQPLSFHPLRGRPFTLAAPPMRKSEYID